MPNPNSDIDCFSRSKKRLSLLPQDFVNEKGGHNRAGSRRKGKESSEMG